MWISSQPIPGPGAVSWVGRWHTGPSCLLAFCSFPVFPATARGGGAGEVEDAQSPPGGETPCSANVCARASCSVFIYQAVSDPGPFGGQTLGPSSSVAESRPMGRCCAWDSGLKTVAALIPWGGLKPSLELKDASLLNSPSYPTSQWDIVMSGNLTDVCSSQIWWSSWRPQAQDVNFSLYLKPSFGSGSCSNAILPPTLKWCLHLCFSWGMQMNKPR